MCLGREVRVPLVLSSWITVLCCGVGVFGKGTAYGAPFDAAGAPCAICRHVVHPHDCLTGLVPSSGTGGGRLSLGDGHRFAVSATAIPDGPGAICLGALGFVCVSAMRSRRVWIGLCLWVLSGGRMSAARLAETGVAGPDWTDPGGPGEGKPGSVLQCHSPCRARRPFVAPGVPEAILLGPQRLYPCLGGLCDDRSPKGLPPWTDPAFGSLREIGPDSVGAIPRVGALSIERVGLARPPPRQATDYSG
jgi:hypothetical protein